MTALTESPAMAEAVAPKSASNATPVDKLFDLLRQKNIRTINRAEHCVVDQKTVCIKFAGVVDAEKFLTGAMPDRDYEEGSLYARGLQGGWPDNWDYAVHLVDVAETVLPNDELIHHGPPSYHFQLILHFPLKDCPLILRNLQRS